MTKLLKQKKAFQLNDLSKIRFDYLTSSRKLRDDSDINYYTNSDSDSDSELDSDSDTDNDAFNHRDETNSDMDDDDDRETIVNTSKSNFFGTRIVNSINSKRKHSYFKIKINDTDKFIHK